MEYTTIMPLRATSAVMFPRWGHLFAVVCFFALAVLGSSPPEVAGWIVLPPCVYDCGRSQRSRQVSRHLKLCWSAAWWYVRRSWRVPLARSIALGLCWWISGRVGPPWLLGWFWIVWGVQIVEVFCPGIGCQGEWLSMRRMLQSVEGLLLRFYLVLAVTHELAGFRPCWGQLPAKGMCSGGVGLLCVGSLVQVRHEPEEGVYTAEIEGHFTLAVGDDDSFRLRLMVLFLRLLEVPGVHRGSRRTRDGRTPFVRQQYLGQVLGIPQPDLSRWEGYWQKGDWRRLLSQVTKEVLTLELQQLIIETWAHWPGWGAKEVHRFLVAQGVAVSESQVWQAAHESGWQIVRQELARMCVRRAEELRLREDWLMGDVLAQLQSLLDRLEGGQQLTPEEQLDLKTLQAAVAETGLGARPPGQAQTWLRRLEQVLFQPWQEVAVEGVRCPHCGSGHVGRKGLKPRLKTFEDAHGQVQKVEVYRYRCHNRACPHASFTVLPVGLLPYSRQRLEAHVLALQMYAWGHSTYRLTGKALGVASITAYRWVSAFGQQLLPMAALFGVVRSSGVVGVDEKWVQVPKNNKPVGKHRKWMYVYVAADAYTYDLLHIAIYPHNTAESAQAFLFALRAKGYHPRVVITDLRRDYGPAIARVFPQAEHHECLFHAAQSLHRQVAEVYGWDAMQHNERVAALCQALDGPLSARTKRTAQQRYDQLMAQRDTWVKERPELAAVFASLEAHWPKLINGIESDLIPRTNNTVELVIRRFDQHYQNFCGFDSLETAERFLGVFEKVYRFTPFSDDAQPRIRGKSPLQLAGYDVANLPMTALCNGWAIALPTRPSQESVPNV